MGQQMELLKHESQLLIAQVGQGVIVEVLNGLTVEAIGPPLGRSRQPRMFMAVLLPIRWPPSRPRNRPDGP